jgi:hypothetical protein
MTYQIADKRNPFMGLDNKICRNPMYWCKLHQVWLSEDDVERKHCKCKLTFDMIGTYRCGCLERKEVRIPCEKIQSSS